MIELVIIIDMECRVVAILYALSVESIKECRSTLLPYSIGVSLSGWEYVLRSVGIKAIRSMATTVMTDIVGSLVISQGINPSRAIARNILSTVGGFLKPYFKEKKNIIIVNISENAVGIAPSPAPLTNWPKNTTRETIDHTSQVYG